MQMRAITKLLGVEMTAEVGFIGGLTQLSWRPHRVTQLSNGCNLMIRADEREEEKNEGEKKKHVKSLIFKPKLR